LRNARRSLCSCVKKNVPNPRKLSAKQEAKKLEADLIKRNGYVCYLCPEDDSAPYMNYDDIRHHIIRIHKGCKDCLSVYPDFEEAETCRDSPYFCHTCRICIETEIEAIQHFAQVHHGNVKPRETRLPVVRKGNGSADLKAKWDAAPIWYCEKCDWFLPRIGKSKAHRCVPYNTKTGVALPQGKRGECHICMEGFDNLAAHVNARHFACDDCDKFFAAGSTLELHVAEQHTPEETEEQ
jgi:hypothetical protein